MLMTICKRFYHRHNAIAKTLTSILHLMSLQPICDVLGSDVNKAELCVRRQIKVYFISDCSEISCKNMILVARRRGNAVCDVIAGSPT